jgi:hypothetical protein
MKWPTKAAFIVGAPRCGTSSLWRVFRQHPDVCFSEVKEPHFFSRFDFADLDDGALKEAVIAGYLDRFFADRRDDSLIMEASPTYFYAPDRMRTIIRLWPDAKFIIALRDPLSMIPSLHSRLLVTGDETVSELKEAWDLIPERREGRKIPSSCLDPRFLRYDEAARFATHLRNFHEAVGEDRCHVVLLDDLSGRPADCYRQVCGFLGLEPWPETRFKVDRTNRSFRIKWLQRLLNRPPKRVQKWLASDQFLQREGMRRSKSRLFKSVAALRKRILRWNEFPADRKPLDEAIQSAIISHYRSEVQELSKVIGRDLSHWLRPRPVGDSPQAG